MQPDYWDKATKHLAKNCPTMKQLIARYKGESLKARPDGFFTLLRAIVGQQISVKAADSVWAKLTKTVDPLTPENLLRKRETTLRKCGLSGSKVAYARNVAAFFKERASATLAPPLRGSGDSGNSQNSRSLVGGRTAQRAASAKRMAKPIPPTKTQERFGSPSRGELKESVRSPSYWDAFSDEEVIRELTDIKGIGSWTAEMFLIFHLLRPDVLPVKDLGLLKAIDLHYTGGRRLTAREYEALSEKWKPYRTVATWYLWRALDPVAVEY